MQRSKILLLAIVALLVAIPATAQTNEYEIVVKDIGGGLAWHTNFEYGHSTLTITGPKKFTHDKNHGRDEVVWEAGELADGQYRWEVRYRNELSSKLVDQLKEARAKGDTQFSCDLVEAGVIQAPVFNGDFVVIDGKIIIPDPTIEEPVNKKPARIADAATALGGSRVPTKDFVINDDLIVDGSACIGFDCVNGESFSFDTIRLKENNLRIKFDDTSVAASFPRTDWQLTANASANGGASKFSIDDISGSRTPFTVEANARSHSLYVDDGGRIGNRTSTPSTEIHTIDGDTPTLRLQQDGSSGFAPQTWDVAGNETNYFIRDVSNGSTLPFRIRPAAPTSSIFIDVDGDVGLSTASPDAALHVTGTDGNTSLLVEEASGTQASRAMMELRNNGQLNFLLARTDGTSGNWSFVHNGATFDITKIGTGFNEMSLNENGNLEVRGDFISNGTTLTVPDYVFESDYELMPLSDLQTFIESNKHLPNIPSATEVKEGGLNLTGLQLKMLEKIEELTLYTLDQQSTIDGQAAVIEELRARLEALESTP